MKKITLSLVMITLFITVLAQTPQAFKYQAVARDNAGNVLANQDVSFQIGLLQGSASGTLVYSETHLVTTNAFGLVNLEIGSGAFVSGVFEEIDWGNGPYFLQVEMDENGGASYQFMGTSQLLSVPYSLYSASTGDTSRWRKSNDDLYFNNGNVGIGTTTPAVDLDIRSSSTALSSKILLGNSDNTNNLFLYSGHETDDPYISFIGGDALRFARYDGGLNELMRIQSDGRVGIGTENPEESALLDLNSTSKGFLPPRMTHAERDAITSPATGLFIYQTDNIAGFYNYNGTEWGPVGNGAFAIDDLSDAITGGDNVFLGENSGVNTNLSGNGGNVALGQYALNLNTSGYDNTAIGNTALRYNTNGNFNVAVGRGANETNQEGSNNTIIGYKAGASPMVHNKSGNIFIGYQAGYWETGNNKLYIENSDASAPLIYGEFDNDLLEINGKLNVTGDIQVNNSGNPNPAAGTIRWNEDTEDFEGYNGTTWKSLTVGAISASACIDYDGNAYPTFTIGNQVWMAENLRVMHYRNGDAIPNVTDDVAWSGLTSGAYCWYDNDQSANGKYGILYNWYAVDDSRSLCPEGWHVPTHTEWTTLTTYLGGTSVAGGKMKSTSNLWNSPNTDATNISNFSGLPGGIRTYDGFFFSIGYYGYWWSSTEYSSDSAWFRELSYNNGFVNVYYYNKQDGFSVRCLRDN